MAHLVAGAGTYLGFFSASLSPFSDWRLARAHLGVCDLRSVDGRRDFDQDHLTCRHRLVKEADG